MKGDDYFRQLYSDRVTAPVLPLETYGENSNLTQGLRVLLQPEKEDYYNLALGPLRFSASAGMGAEWNDNIMLSNSNRLSDLILRPSMTVDAKWRVTEINTLHFSLGLGYGIYTQHPDNNTGGFTLSPSSEMAFTMHVGNNVVITLRDQFSLQDDPIGLVGVNGSTSNNSGSFRRFINMAILSTNWAVNPLLNIGIAYDHYNMWSLDPGQSGIGDQSVDTFSLSPSVNVGPGIVVGMTASASWITYSNQTNTQGANDGMSYGVGPFIQLNLTRNTRMNLGVGYQGTNFNGNSQGADSSGNGSISFNFSIENRLNDFFSHRLAISHTTEPGYTSNYYDLYYVEYAANWRITPSLTIDPRLMYQHYTTSGQGSQSGDRIGGEIGTRYQLTHSLSVGINYRYYQNFANVASGSYYQNLLSLNFYYSF